MTAKLYTNTDVWITLTPGTGFVMADVASASVTLQQVNGVAAPLTLTSAGGTIVLGESTMTVKIPDTLGITVSGVYSVSVKITDVSGNIRGLTPDTEHLTFYS